MYKKRVFWDSQMCPELSSFQGVLIRKVSLYDINQFLRM